MQRDKKELKSENERLEIELESAGDAKARLQSVVGCTRRVEA